MAFGNPYGDPWEVDIVGEWSDRLHSMGVEIISFSDTIGVQNLNQFRIFIFQI